jgi:hypothetical protein
MGKFEIRNQKFEVFGARSARIGVEAWIWESGFEFRISNFEFFIRRFS